MRSPEILRRATIPAVLLLSLGLTACGEERTESVQANCDKLTSVRLIGPAKDGGLNLVNDGQCADLYAGGTFNRIGEVEPNGPMEAICINYAIQPHAIAVRLRSAQSPVSLGEVPLASSLVEDTDFAAALPDCDQFRA